MRRVLLCCIPVLLVACGGGGGTASRETDGGGTGLRVVYSAIPQGATEREIFTANFDGSGVKRLTSNAARDHNARAAGPWVVFTSTRAPEGVYRVSISGGEATLIAEGANSADITTEGAIFYSKANRIYRQNVDIGEGTTPSVSDSGKVAFLAPDTDTGWNYLGVMDSDGSNRTVFDIRVDGGRAAWYFDSLIFRGESGGLKGLFMAESDGSGLRRITTNESGIDHDPTVSGSTLIFSRGGTLMQMNLSGVLTPTPYTALGSDAVLVSFVK